MKGLKRFLYLFLGVMFAFFLFLLWYQNRYSMDVVIPYTINETQFDKRLLIASQGSEFKNEVTSSITNHFKLDSIYIQVLDIEELEGTDPKAFDAIVIMHTWEYGKPPLVVKEFIERTKKYKSKIVVVTTSGEGTYKTENMDAIAGESIIEDVPDIVAGVIRRLAPLLKVN